MVQAVSDLEKRMRDGGSTAIVVPELQSTIALISVLVDSHGNMMDRCHTDVKVETGIVSESVLIGMIHQQRHQRPDKRRFQLADILTFFVPTTPTALKDWSRSTDMMPQLQPRPAVPMDIVVPASLFIFHSINCIWLIFREEVCVGSSSSVKKAAPLAVSILKTPGSNKSNKKHVRISQELPRYKSLLMSTKKKTIKIHH